MAAKTEQQLASEAKQFVSEFNFETRKPSRQADLQLAQALYREIFYKKQFTKMKSRSYRFDFHIKQYQKMTKCSRCAKKIYTQLKEFSEIVLSD